MLVKIIIALLFLFIVYSLARALVYLVRDPANSTQVVRALTWRIIVSIFIFILLFFSMWMGWIHPHGIGG